MNSSLYRKKKVVYVVCETGPRNMLVDWLLGVLLICVILCDDECVKNEIDS